MLRVLQELLVGIRSCCISSEGGMQNVIFYTESKGLIAFSLTVLGSMASTRHARFKV